MVGPSVAEQTTLEGLRKRIEAVDLIPSQEPLRDRIAERFGQLVRAGVTSVEDLQVLTRNKNSLESLANESGSTPTTSTCSAARSEASSQNRSD